MLGGVHEDRGEQQLPGREGLPGVPDGGLLPDHERKPARKHAMFSKLYIFDAFSSLCSEVSVPELIILYIHSIFTLSVPGH